MLAFARRVCLCARTHVCLCAPSCCARHVPSTRRVPSTSLSLDGLQAGRGGDEGLSLQLLSSALAAAQVEAWLEVHNAAAGSSGSCWLSQKCSAPSPSRVLRGPLRLTLAEKKQAWNEVAR